MEHVGPSISSKRLDTLSFLQRIFLKGTLRYMSNDSLNVLLHYKPFLLWVRKALALFQKSRNRLVCPPAAGRMCRVTLQATTEQCASTCSIPGKCVDYRRLPVEYMLAPRSRRRTVPDVTSLCLGILLFK